MKVCLFVSAFTQGFSCDKTLVSTCVFVVCFHVYCVEGPVVLCACVDQSASLFESLLFSSTMMVLLICCQLMMTSADVFVIV